MNTTKKSIRNVGDNIILSYIYASNQSLSHSEIKNNSKKSLPVVNSVTKTVSTNNPLWRDSNSKIYFKIVSVEVIGLKSTTYIYAFLDQGSAVSIINYDVVKILV